MRYFRFLLFALFVRLWASFLPSFSVDMNAWLAWAARLGELGPSGFYTSEVWTQYTPGFLYWLLFLGKSGLSSELLIKLPAILADVGTAALAYKIISKKSQKWALAAFALYLFNPSTIFISSVWGQIDGILAFLMLASVYAALSKKPYLSAFFWAVSFLVKPQSMALVPALALLFFRKYSLKKLLQAGLVGLGVVFVGAFPFFPGNPVFGLPKLIVEMAAYYRFSSLFAFNVWAVLIGMWKADGGHVALGAFFYVGVTAATLFVFKNTKSRGDYYLLSGLGLFSFFLFPTRVHERYLFPALIFILVASGFKKSKKLLGAYFLASFLFLLNSYHAYAFFENNFLANKAVLVVTGALAPFIAAGFIALFFILLFYKKKPKFRFSEGEKMVDSMSPFLVRRILLGVIFFSFATRLIGLGSPPEEYFDEVYHAFTAQTVLSGQPQAWEWWNPNPDGFAYEWTHPPMAKLVMAGSMSIFGRNPLGWRIPAALAGTGVVFLTYTLGKRIFGSREIGLFAGAIMALDGLLLVMSRIGMNDIYFLFFSLLSLHFFLTKRDFLGALAFGFSLASKWSALWLAPVLLVAFLIFRKRPSPSLLWFLVLPPTIYMASYIPMFLTGHNIDTFVEMQKQMWWYHTGLDATHPFTSPWWSWPFLKRPIWLYTTGAMSGKIGNIYAMGNPVVFWAGAASVVYSIYHFLKGRDGRIFFVIFSYFAFFIPWMASPRIMFLYHYLPSLPFMAIAAGFVLKKHPKVLLLFYSSTLLLFAYFFPHWIGLSVPIWLDKSYYWFDSWS